MTEQDLLLDNRFAPVTNTIGFLETDLLTATHAFEKWQQELVAERKEKDTAIEENKINGPLTAALQALLPLNSHEPRRHLFVPAKNSWVAYFNNAHAGTDALALVSYLTTQIKCRGLMVTAITDNRDALTREPGSKYGAITLQLHGPEYVNWDNTIRAISVLNDGGRWTFYQSGTPFPFEVTKQYAARRIPDRFTFDMLSAYSEALGVLPFEESFYLPPDHNHAVLIEKKGPLPPEVKEFTLEEALQ